MDNLQRINLEKLISNSKETFVDNTNKIRVLKHSDLIKMNVNKLIKLKQNNAIKNTFFKDKCCQECSFLFFNYTNIFNKVYNDELDLKILDEFLSCLKEIEDGRLDQTEASVKVGTLLKKLYIDSALKKESENNEIKKSQDRPNSKKISWKEYKVINQNN